MKDIKYNTDLGDYVAKARSKSKMVVFLNGAGNVSGCDNFSLIINQLSESYGIFTVDYLDNARSSVAIKNYTIKDEAEKIAQFGQLKKLKKS